MATSTTADPLQTDLEEGLSGPKEARKISCVRDITYKVIPIVALVLIIFAAGAIVMATFDSQKPLNRNGTIVISSILLILFFFFAIGAFYLYVQKHFPPLAKGPNAPDRPPPEDESFLAMLKKTTTMLTDIHKRLHVPRDPGGVNNPAELESPESQDPQPSHGQWTSEQPYNAVEGRGPRNIGSSRPLRQSRVPPQEASTIERPANGKRFGSPETIPNDMDTRALRQNGREYHGKYGDAVSPMSQSDGSFHHATPAGYPPYDSSGRTNADARTQYRTPEHLMHIQPYREGTHVPLKNRPAPRHGGPDGTRGLPPLREEPFPQQGHGRPEYGTYMARVPEHVSERAFAMIPYGKLDDKYFYPSMPVHGPEAAPYLSDFRDRWTPDRYYGVFGPRTDSTPANTQAPRQGGSSLLKSMDSTEYKKPSDKPTTHRNRRKHDTRAATNPPDKLRKHSFSGPKGHSPGQEQPKRSKKKRVPTPHQKTSKERDTSDHAKAPPEKLGTQKPPSPIPTDPVSPLSSSSSALGVPKVPPKAKLRRGRPAEVVTDDEADEDNGGSSPSPWFYGGATLTNADEQLDAYEGQSLASAVKARLRDAPRGRKRRSVSALGRLEVPPRSSSIGFYSRFTKAFSSD
ncbi:hypothetical protein GGR52DRAFT_574758 [Hypoxylon sp. FL1284]|nr:hypothetical protein GGR52DRAFT_574758 [Hypoxylon sp. FL1284]